MSRTRIHNSIANGTARYAVIRESDGTYSVVDKQKDGGPDRYCFRGSRTSAWREAAQLEEEHREATRTV
jgi:hypothetical protein